MWLTVLLALLNGVLSFVANNFIKLSAFDITVAGVMIIAWSSGNAYIAAIVLVLSYSVISPKELTYIWITLPLALLVAFLAGFIGNPLILLLIHHAIGFASAFFLRYLDVKYAAFAGVHFIFNLAVAKLYLLFF